MTNSVTFVWHWWFGCDFIAPNLLKPGANSQWIDFVVTVIKGLKYMHLSVLSFVRNCCYTKVKFFSDVVF